MGHLSAHLVTTMLSMYCLSPLDAIVFPMAARYISALYDYCGPTTWARMRRRHFATAGPAAWYSEPAISNVWRLPSEYRDVPLGYF